jgi:hypothetical protein
VGAGAACRLLYFPHMSTKDAKRGGSKTRGVVVAPHTVSALRRDVQAGV